MANLTYLPIEQNFETTLSQGLGSGASDLTMNVNAVPSATIPSGYKVMITIEPQTTREENVIVGSFSSANLTMTIDSGGRAQDLGNGKSGTRYQHPSGSKVIISDPFPYYDDVRETFEEKIDKSGGTFTGAIDFTNNDSDATFRIPNMTTAERDAIASPQNGMLIYNTTTGVQQIYDGGTWEDVDTGGPVPNASETVAGIVELATNAELIAGTSSGATGARLVPPNDDAIVTEMANFFNTTDMTGAEAETLTDGSDASALHNHDGEYDAKGDLLAGTAANTKAILPVGNDGEVLTASSGESTGLEWVDTDPVVNNPGISTTGIQTTTQTPSITVDCGRPPKGFIATIDIGVAENQLWSSGLNGSLARVSALVRGEANGNLIKVVEVREQTAGAAPGAYNAQPNPYTGTPGTFTYLNSAATTESPSLVCASPTNSATASLTSISINGNDLEFNFQGTLGGATNFDLLYGVRDLMVF